MQLVRASQVACRPLIACSQSYFGMPCRALYTGRAFQPLSTMPHCPISEPGATTA